ncbi:hypothetical protein DFP72DRAFT_154045 [Ephemerocybe angulata]|uniref:F-box domain-containing protein n=1 Tax=Ephemerocybe angulata TaxID=980116 RepID=A0A8H6LUP5_9AGAR|nr:hypothetical protein DFP72DRAFT_154045 [Tulosesus angulatus]
MSSTVGESLIELDNEIAKLEQDLVALKRRRNGLLPVSQLPPEVLSRAFLFALSFFEIQKWSMKILPEDTKRTICAVSYQWREMAFNTPDFWKKICVCPVSKIQYLDFSLKHMPENVPIYLEAKNMVVGVSDHVQRVLRLGSTRRLLQIFLEAAEFVVRGIFRDLELRSEGTEVLEMKRAALGSEDRPEVRVPCLKAIAGFFPQLRRLCLTAWALPRASELLAFSNLTDLSLERVSELTVAEMHEFLAFLKRAGPISSLRLCFLPTKTSFPEGPWPTNITLSSLKNICLSSVNNDILNILLGAIRLPIGIERVTIDFASPAGSTSTEVSRRSASALNLAFSHTFPPPRSLLVTHRGAGKFKHVAFLAQWDRNRTSSLQANMVVPESAPSHDVDLRILYSLPFTDPGEWILSRLHTIKIHTFPGPSFWETIARIPTLQKVSLIAWQPNDCFIRTLRGGLPNGSSKGQPTKTFPALRSIEVAFILPNRTSQFEIDYGRELANALKTRANSSPEPDLTPNHVHEAHFYLCISQIDKDTHDLLSNVALEVLWTSKTFSQF